MSEHIKRGKGFPKKELRKLIDKGLSAEEIANHFGTKSVQSVRHAMERINRERYEAEQLKYEMEIKSEEAKRRDQERREKMDSMNRVGLLRYAISSENLKALEYLLPANGLNINIMNTPSGKSLVIFPNSNINNIQMKFFKLGFMGHLCAKDDLESEFQVKYVKGAGNTTPQWENMAAPVFLTSSDSDHNNDLEEFLFPYMEKGYITFQNINQIRFSQDYDPELLLKTMQEDADETLLHIHIVYDPSIIFKQGFMPFKLNDNSMEVFPRDSLNNLKNKIFKKNTEILQQSKMNKTMGKIQGLSEKDAISSANQFVKSYYSDIDRITRDLLNVTEIPIYPSPTVKTMIAEEIKRCDPIIRESIEKSFSNE